MEAITDRQPVILHEAPSSGRTIIEKLEHYANDVAFAIVLLTGDDVGGERATGAEHRPRARQNVVLELGYFIGRLGRPRVAALYQSDVDVPSDMDGVVYLPFPNSNWELDLANELKAAGIDTDIGKAARDEFSSPSSSRSRAFP